jgi:hypothetical protein
MKLVAALLLAAPATFAAGLTYPPSGDNQRSTVTQQIGPVTVSVEYSSPRVTLKGTDRRGKIWGHLVPYGMSDLGFNNCKNCPWRAGANENTVFTTDESVKVQGQLLQKGKYGLHMIPGKDQFTVIFSKNTTSWGSFSYDPKEDVLRVTAKPVKSPYHEWLTYEFTDREPDKATVALEWEDLAVPINISVENAPQIYAARMKDELRGDVGFDWHNYDLAADYNMKNKVDLTDALNYAQRAADPQLGGQENFQTLSTLARAQAANGQTDQSKKTFDKALHDPSAKPLDLHQAGRALLADGKKDQALMVFRTNAERFPNQWPVHVGLMRGYAAVGDNGKALEEAKLALQQAPDEGNKKSLQAMIEKLQAGQNNIN